MDLEEFTLVDVEVVRFLSECEDRGIVIGSLPTLCSRVDSSRASRRGTAASSEWCVIREGDTYIARVERSLLSHSLSACLGQPTSKGESIGSQSVLDSTLVPVVRFRHLASVRHYGFDNAVSFQQFSNWQRTCISICEKLTWEDQ